MKSMTVPCGNCPFRKKGGIPLRPSRFKEIERTLRADKTTFPCHKTVVHDASGEHVYTDNEQACAGGMIYRMKLTGQMSQMMRIEERLGMLDMEALMKNAKLVIEPGKWSNPA